MGPNWPEDHTLVNFALDSWHILELKRNHKQSVRDNEVTSTVLRLFSCKRLGKSFWKGCVKDSFSFYLCEIKVIFLLQDEKFKQKISALWPPLSPQCAWCICIMHQPNLPHCSTVKGNILAASTRYSLKDSILSWSCKRSHDPHDAA